MDRRLQENLMAVAVLVVLIAFGIATLHYGWRARMVPIYVCIFSIVLLLMEIVNSNFLKINLTVDDKSMFVKSDTPGEKSCGIAQSEAGGKEPFGLAIVMALFLLVVLLGLNLGIAVFMYAYFKFLNKESVWVSLAWGVATPAALYLLFGLLLGIPFYEGLLLQYLA